MKMMNDSPMRYSNSNNNDIVKEAILEIEQCICNAKMLYCESASIFNFMNIRGYTRLMELKYFKEAKMKVKLGRFVNDKLQMFKPKYEEDKEYKYESIIPFNFYSMDRMSVDTQLIKNMTKTIFEKWLKVLEEDYDCYVELWYDLLAAKTKNAVKLAGFVKCMADHHECKIKMLTREIMRLSAENWDIELIMRDQQKLHDSLRDNHLPRALVY